MAGELPADGAEGAISGGDATRQEDHGSSQSNKGEGECSGIDGSASSHGNWRRGRRQEFRLQTDHSLGGGDYEDEYTS